MKDIINSREFQGDKGPDWPKTFHPRDVPPRDVPPREARQCMIYPAACKHWHTAAALLLILACLPHLFSKQSPVQGANNHWITSVNYSGELEVSAK